MFWKIQTRLKIVFNKHFRLYSKYGPTDLKGKTVGAQKWLQRQFRDPYVKLARQESYRCRSAFKLLEIDDRFDILKPGFVVLDCGAAPGAWSQVAVDRTNSGKTDYGSDFINSKLSTSANDNERGMVISIDIQNIMPIPGAITVPNSDITNQETYAKVLQILDGRRADVVLSDMAPSASGIKTLDHHGMLELCRGALRLSYITLANSGTFLCKMWKSPEQDMFYQLLQKCFHSVRVVKPHASRVDSSELYLLALKFQPH